MRETRQWPKKQSTKHQNLNNFHIEPQSVMALKLLRQLEKLNISMNDTVKTILFSIAIGWIFPDEIISHCTKNEVFH